MCSIGTRSGRRTVIMAVRGKTIQNGLPKYIHIAINPQKELYRSKQPPETTKVRIRDIFDKEHKPLRLKQDRQGKAHDGAVEVCAVVDAAASALVGVATVKQVTDRRHDGRNGNDKKQQQPAPGLEDDVDEQHPRNGTRGPNGAEAGVVLVLQKSWNVGQEGGQQIDE